MKDKSLSAIGGPKHVHGMMCDGQDHGRPDCDVQRAYYANEAQALVNVEAEYLQVCTEIERADLEIGRAHLALNALKEKATGLRTRKQTLRTALLGAGEGARR
jgi:hypothetical protein